MKNPDRRKFLFTAPAAAGLALADGVFSPSSVSAQVAVPAGSDTFTLIPAATVQDGLKSLAVAPGTKPFYRDRNLAFVLTTEKAAAAKEFEWHESRDHIFHILDGSTIYELGGTPKDACSPRKGEWLAPASEGAKTVTVGKGDFLIIPRGTPHRRRTPESVTFGLISPESPTA